MKTSTKIHVQQTHFGVCGIYRVSDLSSTDFVIVMDLVGPLFLNCPLPWATNYPTQFVVGWHSSMDLGPLFQKLPLTLGPPTLHNLLTDL